MPRRKSSGEKPSNHKRGLARPLRLTPPWVMRRSHCLQILQLRPFRELPWLVHGFSTRPGGVSLLEGQPVLNLGYVEWDTHENVAKNRRLLQAALGAESFALAPHKQMHSDMIHLFSVALARACKGDGSVTNRAGVLLAVQTADCVPILLVDPKKRAVAAIHAGWKGTLARITEKAVGRLRLEFGCKPADLLAALGPAIGPCCYEVGAEFVSKFSAQFADASEYFDEPRSGEEPNPLQWLNMMPPGHQPAPRHVHLDLPKANRAQLVAADLRPQNIFSSGLCTACRTDLFFSHRREGAQTGRMMAVIGMHG